MEFNAAISHVFSDTDRALVFIQILLSHGGNYDTGMPTRPTFGTLLEYYLSQGGSAYAVTLDRYKWNLIERVPEIIQKEAEVATSDNDNLMIAWKSCYGISPDYNETVRQCQNVLEELLKDKYLPNDKVTQLGRMIGNIIQNDNLQMEFHGDSVLEREDNKVLLKLIRRIPNFRGMHTAGTGKTPNKEEALFILSTTIYFWNLHRENSETVS
ncbi:MAG: hypothetical protein LBC18_06780 [Opitutaceae bacterium]|nr:hypothetical protein [Opitutaceae bacterium]